MYRNKLFIVNSLLASLQGRQMDPDTYANWVKIKETFEKNGTTDNWYYKRACAIVKGNPDPFDINERK